MGQTGRAARAFQVAHSFVRWLSAASVRNWKIATLIAVAGLLSLTSQSANAAELIVNGNFEAGTATSATGWTQVPSTPFNYAIRASAAENGAPFLSCCSNTATGFSVPINDSFSLLLSQSGTSSGYAFQTITVPAGATGTISFNYRAYVQGAGGTGNQDTVKVDIVTPGTEAGDTSVLATLLSFGPATPFQSGTVTTSLAPFAGQTISIRAFAFGFSFPANLAIDNVSAFVNNPPALSITKSHSGTFTQGGTAAWTIQVGNTGTGPTTGTVVVSDTLPAGYTLASVSGIGWSCSGTTTVTCTTTAVVAGSGGLFNLLTLNVNVPANSPTSVGNAASVFGGGDLVHTNAGSALSSNTDTVTVAQVAASIAVNGGSNQSASISTAFATPMSAIVRDAGNNPVPGVTVTFTAPGSGASGKFPGNVLTANAVTNGSGIATAPTFTANAIAGGPYNVNASAGLLSTAFALTNAQGATTTTVSSSSTSVLMGEPVTLTALVTPAIAPGTVTFNDGATPLCSAVALFAGTATCSTSFTTGGAHSITAHYNVSANFSASTSAAISIAVTDQRFKTVEAIGNFLSLRNDMLLSHEPAAGRQIDRLLQGGDEGAAGASGFTPATAQRGFSTGGLGGLDNAALGSFAGAMGTRDTGAPGSLERATDRAGLSAWSNDSVPTGSYPQVGSLRGAGDGTRVDVSFATNLNQILRYAAGSEGSKLSVNEGARGGSLIDIWVQGEYATFGDDRNASDSSGHFGVIYVGADYVMRPWLLVGGLVQYDEMKQTSTAGGFETQGTGWMVGPYTTVRLSPALFFQARAALGESNNKVRPFLTYEDSFASTRWLVSSSLTGNWSDGPWQFRPSASFAFVEDTSDSYLDHFGILIPSVSTSLGQLKASPEVSYVRVDANGTRFEPRLAASAIWNFKSSESAASFGGTLVGPEELRGKIEAGLGIHFYNGITVDLAASYDGLGSDTYDATAVSGGIRIPMN